MEHTPSADVEILEYGEPVMSPVTPVSPNGCPTPAAVTRAVREVIGFDVSVIDAGLTQSTAADDRPRRGPRRRYPRIGGRAGRESDLRSRVRLRRREPAGRPARDRRDGPRRDDNRARGSHCARRTRRRLLLAAREPDRAQASSRRRGTGRKRPRAGRLRRCAPRGDRSRGIPSNRR